MGGVKEVIDIFWGWGIFFQILLPLIVTSFILFRWPELILGSGKRKSILRLFFSALWFLLKRNIIYIFLLTLFFQLSTLYYNPQPRLQSAVQSHLLKLWYYKAKAPAFPSKRDEPLPPVSDFFKKIVLEKKKSRNISVPLVKAKNPNVVLIIMESFRAYELGAYGSKLGISPNFDRYAKKGILFKNVYSSFPLTKKGQWSILCGSHQHNDYAVFTNYQHAAVKCLPDYFADLGYETWWIHGQSANFDGQRYFMKYHQVKHIVDRQEFPPKAEVLGWGLSDKELMKHSLRVLSKSKKPFFTIMLTLTNHYPYVAPTEFTRDYKAGVSLNQFYSTYNYADAMLGFFLDRFLKTEEGENSLIIITADHGIGKYLLGPRRGEKIPVLGRYQVPLLLLYPKRQRVEGVTINTLGGQNDILPTLLDILKIKENFPSFGKSLVRDYDYRFAKSVAIGGWMLTNDRFFRYYPEKVVLTIDGKPLATKPEDKLWFRLGHEISDIQDWIIKQTDRKFVKASLEKAGW
jgi:phosphoglycerol transferase MdoB-like AlkP superfamily enzyme